MNGSLIEPDYKINTDVEDYSIVYGLIGLHTWDSLLINNYEKPIPDPELEIPPDLDLYYLKFIMQIGFESGKTTRFDEYFFSAYGE